MFLQDIISELQNSLMVQSQFASECKTAINGDGFGVAWYAHRDAPSLFRDVNPAMYAMPSHTIQLDHNSGAGSVTLELV